ncbi:hypothetical protein POSPLADRAFT_1068944 [Postia placenta MAD-698-R-SB12]|uniref:Smr domain-containing protein n=1 Tax=Postia placenta MAD-698-R-SB12 TaxID=670580 RepID=A0A1X6NC80_9APHY|nr:hypothetical protein POSPLADRAFT_1068944 [Postia placenta MAD-698-R-SB12]OSX66247.1 hypothetical protein POSPLADRAFT_1068944 [Postia placenta MAD-698-R-SB12]
MSLHTLPMEVPERWDVVLGLGAIVIVCALAVLAYLCLRPRQRDSNDTERLQPYTGHGDRPPPYGSVSTTAPADYAYRHVHEGEGITPDLSISELRRKYRGPSTLRAEAQREASKKTQCEQQSEACKHKNPSRAARLEDKARAHAQKAQLLNARACRWIFTDHNQGLPADHVDLHGLFVQEAQRYLDMAIAQARQHGITTLHVILGTSFDGVAKLKPVVKQRLQQLSLPHSHPKGNTGVIIVDLSL